MIVCGILSLIGLIFKISKQGEKELLEKLYKNGDINENVYKKYL